MAVLLNLSINCLIWVCITDASCVLLQRDPAEEALKSNNMNLDQAMSALLEKKTELDKRGMAITSHDYNSGLINKPMNCPRPPLLSKDPSADPRLPFMDKVNHFFFLKYCTGNPSSSLALYIALIHILIFVILQVICFIFLAVYVVLFCPADAEWNVWRWWSSTSPGGAAAAASSTTCAASHFLSD